MNYKKHYDALIARAPKEKPKEMYTERHRILPGCLGGKYTKENCVYLTAEEHYVAHQLLAKMYHGNKSLEHSAFMMSTQKRYGSKKYGWLKRAWAKQMSGDNNPLRKMPTDLNPAKSAEARKKMSEANKGEKNPWFGKVGPMAGKPSSMLGRKHTEETRYKMSIAMRGNKNNTNRNEKGQFITARKGDA